jgi:hypothetical protein
LCEEIDEKVQAFLDRPIEGDWPYLWIDATYVKVRQNGRIISVAVIVAVGVNSDGRREVLGMEIGASEAEPFWTAFLRKLMRRDLRGVKRRGAELVARALPPRAVPSRAESLRAPAAEWEDASLRRDPVADHRGEGHGPSRPQRAHGIFRKHDGANQLVVDEADDDLGHLVHRLPYPIRLLAVGVSHEPQHDFRNDLPVDAELVLQPATRLFRAAASPESVVEVVGLGLILRLDVEREPLVERCGIGPALSAVTCSPSSSKSKTACRTVLFVPETQSVSSIALSALPFLNTDR